MSANRKAKEQELPAKEASPTPADHSPPQHDTFDAAVRHLREAIEDAAFETAARFGAFLFQHTVNLAKLLSNGLRGAAVVFFLFGFTYSAWGSLGEVMVFHGSLWAVALGLLIVFGPIGALLVATFRPGRINGQIASENVVQFQPPPAAEPPPTMEQPSHGETAGQAADQEEILPIRMAIKTVAAWFALDGRFLSRGLLVFVFFVVGGASVITVVDLTIAPALGHTYLAQINRLVAHALLTGLQTIIDVSVWLFDIVRASVADAWNRIWQ